MRVRQYLWDDTSGWNIPADDDVGNTQLTLVFASREHLAERDLIGPLRAAAPSGDVIACSTAGEIHGVNVSDDRPVATMVEFDHASTECVVRSVGEHADSRAIGEALARELRPDGLAHVFVLSNGTGVNGSELVAGLTSVLPPDIRVTGGLAGDGDRFEETLVSLNESTDSESVVAVGFYGASLRFGFGSLGGWDAFGPWRTVTRSESNVLYELDDKPALELYKRYLGEHSDGLPATGLLFPLLITPPQGESPLVRTILAVNEDDESMTFAGDVPTGSRAQLMRANFDRLLDGAADAASQAEGSLDAERASLAILISCVGRRLVLKQRTEEEVEAVQQVLGADVPMTGFYSYGEISPAAPNASCELHNQTMTITTISES